MKKKLGVLSVLGKYSLLRFKQLPVIEDIYKIRLLGNTATLEQINVSSLKMKQMDPEEVQDFLIDLTEHYQEEFPLKARIQSIKPDLAVNEPGPALFTLYHMASPIHDIPINYVKPARSELLLYMTNIALATFDSFFIPLSHFLKHFRLLFAGISSYAVRRRLVFRLDASSTFRHQSFLHAPRIIRHSFSTLGSPSSCSRVSSCVSSLSLSSLVLYRSSSTSAVILAGLRSINKAFSSAGSKSQGPASISMKGSHATSPGPKIVVPTRGYVSAHCGEMDQYTVKNMTNSKGKQPESDLTPKHIVATIASCDSKECKTQNCATGKNLNTGATRPNACKEPPQYHKQSPKPHKKIKLELAGNLTSKTPRNKKGVILDPYTQANGKSKRQELVVEKHKVSAPERRFKRNRKYSKYIQTDDRTRVIANAMPADSLVNNPTK